MGDYTVAVWLHTWYELYAKPNIRLATQNRYELMMNIYTIPRIGDIKLGKLTSRDLQKLYKALQENGRVILLPRVKRDSAAPRYAVSI